MWRSARGNFSRLSALLGIGLTAASLGVFHLSFAQNLPSEHELNKNGEFRVAIIGSGIGGSSAAYFIQKALKTSVRIDVFEKTEKIGGRMAVIEIDKNLYEAGGAVIHDSNRYMDEFCKVSGLSKLDNGTGERLGIFDGKDFVFLSSGYSLFDKFKLFLRYGFDLFRMNQFTTKTMEKFDNVYKIQDNGESFETVPDLLKALGGNEFVEMTQVSAKKLLEKRGLHSKIINELATAVSRCNYGQDMGLNAFTGFVSLAGAQSGKLWSVKGGNYQVCKRILEHSGVNLLFNSKVTRISKKMTEKNKLKYALDVNGKATEFLYDAVIVAVPLEVKSDFIACSKCSKWPKQEELGHYQQTVATFVKGELNHTSFGLSKASDAPNSIFTVESPDLFYNSVGDLHTVYNDRAGPGELLVYKVFSREVLTDSQLKYLFKRIEGKAKRIDWLAYPHYTPPEKFTPFKLDDGVFYVNAIERAASAMEMGAIGGRNAALLAIQYHKIGQPKVVNNKAGNFKGEL